MTLVTVDPVGSADYTVRGRRKSAPRVVDQYAGWYSHAPRFDVWQGNGLVPGPLPGITGQPAVPQPRQSVGVRTGRLAPSRWISRDLEGRGVSAPAANDLVSRMPRPQRTGSGPGIRPQRDHLLRQGRSS
jgi:hypothetical protein